MYKYAIIETMFQEEGILGKQEIIYMSNDQKELLSTMSNEFFPKYEAAYGKYYYVKKENERPDFSITGCPFFIRKYYCTHKLDGSQIIVYLTAIHVEDED